MRPGSPSQPKQRHRCQEAAFGKPAVRLELFEHPVLSSSPDIPSPAELLATPERALDLPPAVAAPLLAKVEGLAALLRVAASRSTGLDRVGRGDVGSEGRLLTPDEAARLASVPRRTIYGWSRRLDWRPFCRRFSRKVLRIEESGFRRWLERHRQL